MTPELERAIELARQVGAPPPSAARREEVRTALLAAASVAGPTRRRARRAWIGAAVAVAAAAVVLIGVAVFARAHDDTVAANASSHHDSVASAAPSHDTVAVAAHRHGSVHAHPSTSFAAVSSAPDEIVVLHDGTLDVEVAPLHPGERFRVIVGDAEVEVHGTAFAVTARGDQLLDVVVDHGVVEVRARDGRHMLTAGQSWHAPTPAPVVVRPTAKPTPAAVHREPPTPPRAPDEVAYDEGWAAMRANHFTQAASAFARVKLLAGGPLAEDASYWYAVALGRAGQPAGAAFREFLDAFPQSRRAGEASAMLGWIFVEAGNAREAEQRFRVASKDPDAAIRASAEAGLAAVANMK